MSKVSIREFKCEMINFALEKASLADDFNPEFLDEIERVVSLCEQVLKEQRQTEFEQKYNLKKVDAEAPKLSEEAREAIKKADKARRRM